MSDPEDTHDDCDICPECRAVEQFTDGRCICGFGVCHGCLSEPVLIDRNRHHCEECGGKDFCSICSRPIPMDSFYPLCPRCERTARHPNCGPAQPHPYRRATP